MAALQSTSSHGDDFFGASSANFFATDATAHTDVWSRNSFSDYEPYVAGQAVSQVLGFATPSIPGQVDWSAYQPSTSTSSDVPAATTSTVGDLVRKAADAANSQTSSPKAGNERFFAPGDLAGKKRPLSAQSFDSQPSHASFETAVTTPPRSPKSNKRPRLDAFDERPLQEPVWASTTSGHDSTNSEALASTIESGVMPFITKLHHLLANPELYGDCLRWDGTGKSFIVAQNNPRLSSDVLPSVFAHSQVASLTRQLNIYSFTRMSTTDLGSRIDQSDPSAAPLSQYSGWSHPSFVAGSSVAQLETLKPKPSKARLRRKAEKQCRGREKAAAGR